MPKYQVKVFTGDRALSHTFNSVFIKLVGEDDESDRAPLTGAGGYFHGSESNHEVSCRESLGKLLMVFLDKQPQWVFPVDDWFVDKVEVTSPEGELYKFPIYHWITDDQVHCYSQGTAVLVYDEYNDDTKYVRRQELKKRKEEYCWKEFQEGIPWCLEEDNPLDLPPEVKFSYTKTAEFVRTAAEGFAAMKLSGLANLEEPWTEFDAIHRVFNWHKNDAAKYVYEHWKSDAFFGYQYLNGLNPILIRRCSSLPSNFPVTDEMVKLEGGATLKHEMKNGNIFLCDYKILDGVKTRLINDEQQFLAAPLVLFHKTSNDDLKPVAIQLKQKHAEDNPIFYPSDHEYDWLLAKTFVRSADFSEHELNAHLLRTHLLSEVYAVALLRNIPRVHPLYKLLIPHTRYTLHINVLARKFLISPNGSFTEYTASGGEGMFTILKRSTSSLTYSSLCLPEDIKNRGVDSVPNYFYRDDGLRLWEIIHRFVDKVLTYYYKDDGMIQKDTELQAYIKDIFERGFLSNTDSGIPQSFSTVDELVKFVTMVMFTGSAQHSAVNTGQLDFGNWMPNFPTSLQMAPPSVKDRGNEHILLQTLPDVNTTVHGLAVLWLLSKESSDFVPLGDYPEELFCEDVPCEAIRKFNQELRDLDHDIDQRNKGLDLPYTYMKPVQMENSVAI